jgi:hypothetical protein
VNGGAHLWITSFSQEESGKMLFTGLGGCQSISAAFFPAFLPRGKNQVKMFAGIAARRSDGSESRSALAWCSTSR